MRQSKKTSEHDADERLPELDFGRLKSSGEERIAAWRKLVGLCTRRRMGPEDIWSEAGISRGYFYKVEASEHVPGIEPILTLHAALSGHAKIDLALEQMPSIGLTPG